MGSWFQMTLKLTGRWLLPLQTPPRALIGRLVTDVQPPLSGCSSAATGGHDYISQSSRRLEEGSSGDSLLGSLRGLEGERGEV